MLALAEGSEFLNIQILLSVKSHLKSCQLRYKYCNPFRVNEKKNNISISNLLLVRILEEMTNKQKEIFTALHYTWCIQ